MAVQPAHDPVVDRVQALLERIDGIADPAVRATVEDLIATLMDLYGGGLERVMAIVDEPAREALAADGVVASLLLLHGLYPVDLETRVREALDSVAPYMASHGGAVELLGISEDDVVTLRLEGACKTCAASASTLELAIKTALEEHAPDLAGVEVIGADAPVAPLDVVQVRPGWSALGGAAAVADGELAAETVGATAIVVANVDGTLLAYEDRCPACGAALSSGELFGPNLACACGAHYDLTRAGRPLGGAAGQLRPVPLLRDDGGVRVAA